MQKVILSQIATLFNGKTRPSTSGSYPVYGGNGIIDYAGEYNSEENTIIIGRVGAYCGNVEYSVSKCWVTDNAIGIKVNNGFSTEYIYYLLKKRNLNKLSGGSGQPLMTQTLLNKLKLDLPEFADQVKIVDNIRSFDKKIELNLTLRSSLEEYLQLLFHKWLINSNFLNEKMKHYKNTGEKITTLDFCYQVTDGTHDTPKPVDEGFHLVTSKHIKNGVLDTKGAYFISENDYFEINKRSKVEQWDILFSMIGSVGEVYLEATPSPKYAIKNLGLFKMNGDKDKAVKLYLYLKSPYFQKMLNFWLSGSIQSFVPLNFLRNIKLPKQFFNVSENDKVLFDTLGLIVEKLYNLRKENTLLEESRDLLIKKLVK